MDYSLVIADTETTGMDSRENDIIEVSFYRYSETESDPEVDQKTWLIKPFRFDTITDDALRINGHKLEHLSRYPEPSKVIIEMENWLAEDNYPAPNRILCGQNVGFDKDMLEQFWIKCGSKDSFPFGRRYIDTTQIQFVLDWCSGKMEESYSLNALIKRYGIKNEKAHSAASDTLATKQLFENQIALIRKMLAKCPLD